MWRGLVASGDQFFGSVDASNALRATLPSVLAVEMEGAAVAQVCYEHGVPFAIARVISDTANHAAAVDFSRFLPSVWTVRAGPCRRSTRILKWSVVAFALALCVGCKNKEVPFTPPPKDDAALVAFDAASASDAAVALEKPTARKVVIGDDFTCALLADETIRCWGKNSEGQLGNGTTADSGKPVMPALRGVKDIVARPCTRMRAPR